MTYPDPKKAYWEGAVLLMIGLGLIGELGHWHAVLSLLSLPCALLLIGSGVGLLAWPGDRRLPQFASLGVVLGILPVPMLAISGEIMSALGLAIGLVVAYFCAGRAALQHFAQFDEAPTVETHPKAAAHIATDEFLMAIFKALSKPPRGGDILRIEEELLGWEDYLKSKRLRSKLHRLHPEPPDLLKVDSADKSLLGRPYRHISFDSEFELDAAIPGASRWNGYTSNNKAHAWILEHEGAARPWLLCIHGYRMGTPLLDLRCFDPGFFHDKLGLNMASVVLPLHGPRRRGLVSGQGYLEGDFMDFIHAERQAQWDIRRLLSWLRLVKHAPRIGVYGVSLGGYNTALLAGLDNDLSCAVAGIPVADMAQMQWRHFPEPEIAMLENRGVTLSRIQQAYAAVSPLTFTPQIAREGLGIFAGSVDSIVWPDQPLQLREHWDGARLNWYEGAHLTFMGQAALKQTLLDTFQAGRLID